MLLLRMQVTFLCKTETLFSTGTDNPSNIGYKNRTEERNDAEKKKQRNIDKRNKIQFYWISVGPLNIYRLNRFMYLIFFFEFSFLFFNKVFWWIVTIRLTWINMPFSPQITSTTHIIIIFTLFYFPFSLDLWPFLTLIDGFHSPRFRSMVFPFFN